MIASARLTPEETAWFCTRIELDVSPNSSYRLYGLGAGHVSRQKHVEVAKVRLAEAVVELKDFSCRRLGAFDLLVRSVVA